MADLRVEVVLTQARVHQCPLLTLTHYYHYYFTMTWAKATAQDLFNTQTKFFFNTLIIVLSKFVLRRVQLLGDISIPFDTYT